MISYMVKGFREFVKKILALAKRNSGKKLSALNFIPALILLTAGQTILIESIQRGSLTAAWIWLSRHLFIFLLNIVLAVIINFLCLSLSGSLAKAFSYSTIFLLIFTVVNQVKMQFLGEPLLPWDFSRIGQAANLLPKIAGEIGGVLVLFVLLLIGLFLLCRLFIPGHKVGRRARCALLIAVVLLAPVLIFYRHTPLQIVLNKANIEHLFWVPSENNLQNGILLGFTMNLENVMIFQPKDYGREAIQRITGENNPENSAGGGSAAGGSGNTGATAALGISGAAGNDNKTGQPNVVFVLNESFWDPTVLPDVKFSEDPLPFFRELQAKNPSGIMISPVFGGSTANTEFEILTGLSTKFLPEGAIAYQEYIRRALPSVPAVFKANGYATIAIHPYHDWFYKRNLVYPLLGFERFASLDSFAGAQIKGEYIGDLEVSKKVVAELKQTPGPAFIFALTMQNHGPYPENRYNVREITADGTLSAQGKDILETYTQGVRDADDALKYLIGQIGKLNEPTAVIFVGDHLPYLGKDYLVYKQTGYIKESENQWSVADTLKMKSVPYVIWSNYQPGSRPQAVMSSQLFAPCLLELAQIRDNSLISLVRKFGRQLPVFAKTITVDSKNNLSSGLPGSINSLEKDYWLLEYDLLFGKQYYYDFTGE